MGHAAEMPEFRRLGLRLVVEPDGDGYPKIGRHTQFSAPQHLFKIPMYVADYLFDSATYPLAKRRSPKYVADRIKRVCEKGLKDEDAG